MDGEGTLPPLALIGWILMTPGDSRIHRSCCPSFPPEERPALERLREVAQAIHQ
jgi:hypothetical protein